MNLGITGRTAIVCGASKGLGRGCAAALAKEGVRIILNARDAATLERTAQEIRAAATAQVVPVAADVTTAEGRAALVEACPNPDILVTNSGGPPPGDFRDWDEAAWHRAVQNNMVAHILLIKAVLDGMTARRFGRIVNITSAAVKAPYPSLGLSNGARAGLTGFVAGLSRKTVINNVTINALLPGPFETDRLRGTAKAEAEKRGITPEQLLAERAKLNPAGRFGDPDEFGYACAFLCGAKAGFITGQNILLDGGAFPGTL
jgi:3-oxoacyl-[acyl-carrier protein] reductase